MNICSRRGEGGTEMRRINPSLIFRGGLHREGVSQGFFDDLMVKFKYQRGCAMVPRYLVKQYSGWFCEGVAG